MPAEKEEGGFQRRRGQEEKQRQEHAATKPGGDAVCQLAEDIRSAFPFRVENISCSYFLGCWLKSHYVIWLAKLLKIYLANKIIAHSIRTCLTYSYLLGIICKIHRRSPLRLWQRFNPLPLPPPCPHAYGYKINNKRPPPISIQH